MSALPTPLRDLPVCRRCSRLAETCVYFDARGCMGVPCPRDLMAPANTEVLNAMARGWERAAAYHGRRGR